MIDGDDGSHSSSPASNELPECPQCEGRGWFVESCCGDDISDNIEETDICPNCYEHCGDDRVDCDSCCGEGVITEDEHKEHYSND